MDNIQLKALEDALKCVDLEEIEDLIGFDLMLSKPILNQLTESEKAMLYNEYVLNNQEYIR